MLKERSQTQKATYYVSPFIRNVQNRQQKVDYGCQGLKGGEMERDC